jgi:hypothetical protein
MVELSLFLSILAITLPICLTGVFVAKLYRKNADLDPKITNKLRKQQDDYIGEVERKNRSLQNKLNSMQKGPELSQIGDLEGVLPELIGQLDGVLPKWLTKFIKGQPDLVNTVVKYAKDNPDKAKELIGRFVKIKPKAQTASDDTLPGL